MQNNPYSEALMMSYNIPQKQIVSPQIQAYFNRLVDNLLQTTPKQPTPSDYGWGFAGSSVGTAGAANARDYDEGETEFYHDMANQALDRYYKGLEQLYREDPKKYYELQKKYNTPNQYGITPYRNTNSYYMGNGKWSQ